MSRPVFTRNNVGRVARPTSYEYEQQKSAMINQFGKSYEAVASKLPNIYSQPPATRYIEQMPESEPLSEYTEMPLSMTRATPAPFRQQTFASQRQMMSPMTPQHFNMHQQRTEPVNVLYQEMQSPKMCHESQGFIARNLPPSSPYARPPPSLNMMPPPTPQRLVPSYNPDQSFVMRSLSSGSIPASPEVNKPSTQNKSSPGSSKKILPVKSRLTSVNRKRFFVGTVEQVVQWHQMIKNTEMSAVYEVAGILDSLTRSQKGVVQMILRNEQKGTNAIQVIFYPIDRDLPKVKVGELVTCVGRMIASKKMQVFDMWPTSADSLVGLKRISFLCQRTLQEANLRAVPEP